MCVEGKLAGQSVKQVACGAFHTAALTIVGDIAINMSVFFWYRYYFSKLSAVFTKPKSELKVSATECYGYAHQPGKLKCRRTVKKAAAAPPST